MLALKYVLMAGGLGMILAAVGILGYDLYRELLYRRALATPGAGTAPPLPQWRCTTPSHQASGPGRTPRGVMSLRPQFPAAPPLSMNSPRPRDRSFAAQ